MGVPFRLPMTPISASSSAPFRDSAMLGGLPCVPCCRLGGRIPIVPTVEVFDVLRYAFAVLVVPILELI